MLLKSMVALLALAVATAAMVAAGPNHDHPDADDDSGRCGVTLVLRNPDLQEDEAGYFQAAGWFFVQFQAVGQGAENVEYITFSFGKPRPDESNIDCNDPTWFTGGYIQNYRGDYDPSDGFFVPINTTAVPDDEYGAALHAFDANDNEIGRYWVRAIVDNCDGGQGARCGDDPAQVAKHDNIMPWPIILPGDGVQTNDIAGVTIEFSEALTTIEAFINGEQIELDTWPGREFDDDLIPGNDGDPCGATPGCNKRVWGPAYKWEGQIQENDILKVHAVDKAGNTAEKIIHLLDPNAGGIIVGDIVQIDLQVDASTKQTPPGVEVPFAITATNVASSEAHVNFFAEGSDELAMVWDPDHLVIPGGERGQTFLRVTPPTTAHTGRFEIDARAEYQQGSSLTSEVIKLAVELGSGAGVNGTRDGNGTAESGNGTGGADAPGPNVALLLAAGVASLVAARSRRHR